MVPPLEAPPPLPPDPPPVQVDTEKFTAVPSATSTPFSGSWVWTLPGSTQLLLWETLPTTSPALAIAVHASASVRPSMLGTVTWPAEMPKITVEPERITMVPRNVAGCCV